MNCSTTQDLFITKEKIAADQTHTVKDAKPRNVQININEVISYNTNEKIIESLCNQNSHITAGLKKDDSLQMSDTDN